MKVLYVCTSTDTGGAEISLYQLASACHNAGHQVKVISLKNTGAVAKRLQERNIEVISLHLTGKISLIETAHVLSHLIQQIQDFQPDIVHASLFRAIQLCRIAKKYNNFRLITTPHYNLAKKSIFWRLLDRVLREYDDISCAESYTTAKFLRQKQHYNKEKLRLVPNGVNTTIFSPNAEKRLRLRKELGFSLEDIIFCCVARLSKEKNHHLLLDSFAALQSHNQQVKLLLIGDGPLKEQLQQKASFYNIKQKVKFVGEVSNVSDFLLVSDIFILISTIESLPLALLEACSCGLPAIVSKIGDMPRVILHGKTGFVCNSKDSVLISVLMDELAVNTVLRNEMGQKSREHIKQYYQLSEESYLKIYQQFK